MSTRGVIARAGEQQGEFTGVYNHSDSYPAFMGPHLWKMLHEQYAGNLPAMLRSIIDEHAAGLSLVGKECYCHPTGDREAETEPELLTNQNVTDEDTDLEWLWVFDERTHWLYIRDRRHKTDAATVDLRGTEPTEPDWMTIQCGENLERCSHCAWVHFPDMKGTNLSTQTYLGRREFEMRDAIAFIVDGKRYADTGSGGHSDYFNRCQFMQERNKSKLKFWPSNLWIQDVKGANGKRVKMPIANITKDGYTPYPGVTWVFPPTKVNPSETLKS